MKLLHLADLHLGKSVCELSMLEDQTYLLERLLEIIRDRRVDAVLLAGDVYDKKVPVEPAVQLLDTFLSRLAELGVQVLLISGNHDSAERLNFARAFFRARGVHVAGKYTGTLSKVTLQDEHGPVNFYLLPYFSRSLVAHYHPEASLETEEDAIRLVLESDGAINEAERNVVLAHQFVMGGQVPDLAGSEQRAELRQSVGTLDCVSAEVFKEFDYVALGHIHRPQQVGRETVRYAGSLMKYSLSEAGQAKSAPLVTLGPKGQTELELIPLQPLHDLRHVKKPLAELVEEGQAAPTEDFIYATLTDETPVQDAMLVLRGVYPNIMKLDYDNSRTRKELEPEAAEERSFAQLIGDFSQRMQGRDLTQEEMTILEELAREAGVLA